MSRITCNFQGRLGNLMFETACVLATAWRQKLEPCWPQEECQYYKDITAFGHFIKPVLKAYGTFTDPAPFKRHEENYKKFEALPAFTTDTMLYGFYTSSRYFNDYRREIIDVFTKTYRADVAVRVEELRRRHIGKQLVAVHVRRADYVTDYFWDLPLSYYEAAAAKFPDAEFVVFSDDLDWCNKNLGFMRRPDIVNDRDYMAIQVMSRMDAIIIANSTFSAWGAMLGDPDCNKTVVAPACWVPPGRGNHNADIYEPHWIRL